VTSSGAAREVSVPYATLSDAGAYGKIRARLHAFDLQPGGVGVTENSPGDDVSGPLVGTLG
jgi:hypothetical protein